jgi:sterol desaturase/sphingolipid hydroxylase (fatty acid hydroxylase superfamily)
MQETVIHFLRNAPVGILAALIAAENLLILGMTVVFGGWLAKRYVHRAVAETAPPITRNEIALALTTVLLNFLVTLAGLFLWRWGVIEFRTDTGLAVLWDFLFLVLVMDVCMYVLHRAAHVPLFFKVIHRTHHHYDNPRPLTLFVMNPLEALSFGLLWLAVVSVYDATWLGMALYLVFNVVFGLIGHVGVEPLPDRWKRTPLLKHISTSSFHAGHHHDDGHNFGFYTLIWDRIFDTLAPRYEEDFAHKPTL